MSSNLFNLNNCNFNNVEELEDFLAENFSNYKLGKDKNNQLIVYLGLTETSDR